MTYKEETWSTLQTWLPKLEDDTWAQLRKYTELMREWNEKINLVSRKNMDAFEVRHLAHCLAATTFLKLMNRTSVLDVGTGGGLPGIPLAICYPHAQFTLVDSIAKKITVVEDITNRLGLKNVRVVRGRAEELPTRKTYDFVTGRAVTTIPRFHGWIRDRLHKGQRNSIGNGILYWKGGDWKNELEDSHLQPTRVWDAGEILPDAGYEEKFILHFKA